VATRSGGVYKSTNGGALWSPVNTGLTSPTIQALGISPNYPADHTVFAGTPYFGVFFSTDGGANWNETNSGLSSLDIHALAFSPNYTSDETVLAGSGDGVFLSQDGGASWVIIGIPILSP
jgi:photosystem II stability/assembly factor-like uncharacterized protein